MLSTKKQQNLTKIVFGIYLFLLTWLVLFKFGLDFSALPHDRFLNLIPFKESLFPDGGFNFREVGYNILVFVPLGVYVNMLWKKRPFWQKLLPAFALSLAYEIIQFAFAIGISDITDVIGNTLGGIAGLFCFTLLSRIFKEKTAAIVNSAGMAVEFFGIVLLIVLLIANF